MGKVTYVAAATMAAFFCLSGTAHADEWVVKNAIPRKRWWWTNPSCARPVPIRTPVIRCMAAMAPMAAVRIGPGTCTLAGIDSPSPRQARLNPEYRAISRAVVVTG